MNHILNNMKFLQLEELDINYKITISKNKTMSFRFLRDGTVNIIVPFKYNQTMADIIVNKYLDKIVERVNYRKELIATFSNNEEFLFLGKKYLMKVVQSKYPKVYLSDENLFIYTKEDNYDVKEKLIYSFLFEEAENIFNELLYQAFSDMKDYLNQYPTLEIKRFKSVWGLCRIKKNIIALNVDLIHVDIDCIKYVIYHELCHFIYPNHQKGFHELLNKFIDEKNIKHKLKSYKIKK